MLGVVAGGWVVSGAEDWLGGAEPCCAKAVEAKALNASPDSRPALNLVIFHPRLLWRAMLLPPFFLGDWELRPKRRARQCREASFFRAISQRHRMWAELLRRSSLACNKQRLLLGSHRAEPIAITRIVKHQAVLATPVPNRISETMMFVAPVRDLAFALEVADLPRLMRETHPELDSETLRAILEEAGRFATGVLAPLNRKGDKHGARFENGQVISAPGFAEALRAYGDGGWAGLSASTEHGGQGLPRALSLAVFEMVHAANMAFGLCPMLTEAAAEAIAAHGTPARRCCTCLQ